MSTYYLEKPKKILEHTACHSLEIYQLLAKKHLFSLIQVFLVADGADLVWLFSAGDEFVASRRSSTSEENFEK